MIDPIHIRLKADIPGLFKEFDHITPDNNADISIDNGDGFWVVGYCGQEEVWVKTLEDKIKRTHSGEKRPILILTGDDNLLPYCMKDRLAYLQDKINKEKGRHGN